LFLGIVARAQAEKMTTSGAVHGGQTAGFLRADEEEGEALIEHLMREEPEVGRPVEVLLAVADAGRAVSEREPEGGVIESLLGGDEEAEPEPERYAEPEPEGARGEGGERCGDEVDRSVIDSLLDEPERDR
jgi:hypothetical protein